jgi:hypothetical protein
MPHTVLGFFCDGYPRIYDSSNVFFDCDWTKIDYDEEVRKTFMEEYYNLTDLKISHLGIESIIYFTNEEPMPRTELSKIINSCVMKNDEAKFRSEITPYNAKEIFQYLLWKPKKNVRKFLEIILNDNPTIPFSYPDFVSYLRRNDVNVTPENVKLLTRWVLQANGIDVFFSFPVKFDNPDFIDIYLEYGFPDISREITRLFSLKLVKFNRLDVLDNFIDECKNNEERMDNYIDTILGMRQEEKWIILDYLSKHGVKSSHLKSKPEQVNL